MAYYITDLPPVFEIDGVQEHVKARDARWENMVEVKNEDGLFTYATKEKNFLFDWIDISEGDLGAWWNSKGRSNVRVVLAGHNDDDYSTTVLDDAGIHPSLGSYGTNPNANPIVMRPGDEVMFVESKQAFFSLYNTWIHHITNLRK